MISLRGALKEEYLVFLFHSLHIPFFAVLSYCLDRQLASKLAEKQVDCDVLAKAARARLSWQVILSVVHALVSPCVLSCDDRAVFQVARGQRAMVVRHISNDFNLNHIALAESNLVSTSGSLGTPQILVWSIFALFSLDTHGVRVSARL